MGSTHTPTRTRDRGFTILEVGVAMAVLGILLGVGAVSARLYMAERDLVAWSDAIVSDVRAGQQLGISRRASMVVTFTARAGSTPATYTTVIGGRTVRRQPLPFAFDLPSVTVTYNSLGVPQVEASVTVTLAHSTLGRTRTVTITPVTGAVSVSEP